MLAFLDDRRAWHPVYGYGWARGRVQRDGTILCTWDTDADEHAAETANGWSLYDAEDVRLVELVPVVQVDNAVRNYIDRERADDA